MLCPPLWLRPFVGGPQGWKARQAEAKDAAAPADPPAGRPKGGRGKPTTPTGQERCAGGGRRVAGSGSEGR